MMKARPWLSCWTILLMAANPAHAQSTPHQVEVRVAPTGAHIVIPVGLLRSAGDSLAFVLTWSTSPYRADGRIALGVRVPRSDSVWAGLATAFLIEPAGKLGAIIPLPDTAVRARLEHSVLRVGLGTSAALKSLLAWRPDSISFESPPWGYQAAYWTWVRPSYRLPTA